MINGVRIKPLVWHEYPNSKHDHGVGVWEANSTRRTYTILDVGADGKNGDRYYFRGYSQMPTLDRAKAAAQAEHDAMIWAAIEPAEGATP